MENPSYNITISIWRHNVSAKTKIVVLHMKELIYTAIFVGLGILLIILLLFMFLPKEEEGESVPTMHHYVAGVYSSSIMFNDNTVDVQVIVDENRINSISLVNLDDTVTTMYPLMEPAVESISKQVIEKQSTEGITYNSENQYTSIVILNAIENALSKAQAGQTEE